MMTFFFFYRGGISKKLNRKWKLKYVMVLKKENQQNGSKTVQNFNLPWKQEPHLNCEHFVIISVVYTVKTMQNCCPFLINTSKSPTKSMDDHFSGLIQDEKGNRALSLTWPASMQIYWNKRKFFT